MERIITPSNIKELPKGMPVIFIAGPIQGSSDWQANAYGYLITSGKKLIVASPRNLYPKNIPYNEQVDWETHYLNRAAENGVIMFYLAKERDHVCERAYAQTSRFELGEWKVRHERDGTNLVIGIEPGFSNERYIRRRLSQDCPDISVSDGLWETCQKALEFIV
jgi:hypothetical protein